MASPTAEAVETTAAADGGEAGVPEASVQAVEGCPSVSIGLEVLVIAVEPTDSQTTLPAIQQALEFQGTPYTVFVASPRPSDPAADRLASLLSFECEGFYQAVILGNGQAAYPDPTAGWQSALTDAEWRTLWTYERDFGVRQATWYTFPTAEYGFQPPTAGFDTTANPIEASFTGPGRTTFSYANTSNPVTIRNVWAYQAKPLDGNTSSLFLDRDGNALGAIKNYPDGTQNLALTFDSNPFVRQQLVLAYGVLNWVTGGIFLGERHIFLAPQVDDIFLDAHIWQEGTACGTDTEQNNAFYRMTADDLQAVIDWQTARRGQPTTGNFRFDFVFNGEGTTGIYDPDTLTPLAVEGQSLFKWINHTFTHANLDEVTYAEALDEIEQNNQTAQQFGLSTYTRRNLVTPDVSGLENPEAMRATFDAGVRNVVSDASRAGYDNPAPNVGIYNPHQPSILMVPRHANNLFYNVTNPAQWTEEYNCIYRAFWGRDLAYDEILENESDVLLRFMLIGDMDPLMFHETNLRAYAGSRTLLSDLLDRLLSKYDALFSLPVLSPTMDNLALRMAQRMAYRSAAVSAILIRGEQITIRAHGAALVPLTGLNLAGAETYGGQPIAHVDVGAGETVVIPLRPQAGDDSYTVAEGSTLTVPAPGVLANDSDAQGDPLTASLVTRPTHGTVALQSNGSFVYTHDGSETVSDTFVYEARDSGGAASNPSTVRIMVTPVNDAPLAADDAYTMGALDLVLVVPAPGVLANDSDAEGDALTASLVRGPNQGTVILQPDGSFVYTPLP
ncbi:MAG: Ig-like domain-containing protein, partial [Anaerolineales bacterium]